MGPLEKFCSLYFYEKIKIKSIYLSTTIVIVQRAMVNI